MSLLLFVLSDISSSIDTDKTIDQMGHLSVVGVAARESAYRVVFTTTVIVVVLDRQIGRRTRISTKHSPLKIDRIQREIDRASPYSSHIRFGFDSIRFDRPFTS